MTANEVLKKYYGYSNFRPGQEQLIEHLVNGVDVLGIMPTGAGKSICYQVPAVVLEGVTIVISPLISLMKDQVDNLKEIGISAGVINSTLNTLEYNHVMTLARDGVYKMLYVAPERLSTNDFISLSQEIDITMVIIDEAHCISQWGHDFRPSYREIATYIRALPKRPVIGAFTATATKRVKEDILALLHLQNPYVHITGFDRSNLYFEVQKPKHKQAWVMNYLKEETTESGIIYCSTRKSVDMLYEKLKKNNCLVGRYHAGLSEGERRQNQEDFLYDRTQIMVATNAFGMGIDKSNIRFVIHYNMPKNIESYYQEIGRAGRDGVDSKCILLYGASDIMTNRLLIENGNMGKDLTGEYDKLNQMVDYCNTEGCLRSYILTYFGENAIPPCENCGNCNSEIQKQDITIEAQKILSCIKRMQERFGIVMVVDVLKGANTQKIRQFGFTSLTTYGIMKDYTKEALKEIIAFLIAEKYIILEGDGYPTLSLTSRAYNVLKGNEVVFMRILLEKTKEKQHSRGEVLPKDSGLFDKIKNIRSNIASQQGVPPFVIFSDATLNEMATYYPTTKEEMLMISGVGQIKYDKYGKTFLDVILEYINHYDIKKPEYFKEESKKGNKKESYLESYLLYKEGVSLNDIAKTRGLSVTTVESHLAKSLENGLDVNLYDFMSAEDEAMIEKAIKAVGEDYLKPIKEILPDTITYTAIKLVLQKPKYN